MSVTVNELNALAEKIAHLRAQEEEAGRAKKVITEELEAAEAQMVMLLTENDMRSYKAPAGNVVLAFRTSVKTPKTPEDREAFFAHLKEQGLYDAMVTVNSATLNAFYKDQLERAKLDGRDDFEIPGLKEVSITPTLQFRRG